MTALSTTEVPKPKRADLDAAGHRAREERVRRFRAMLFSTPGRLRQSAVVTWGLTILLIAAAWASVEKHRREMQTIGRDSAPSIIAADRIKADLAEVHGDFLRQFLGTAAQTQEAAADYRIKRREVTEGILTAAQNITYGDSERKPIRQLLNGLSGYDDAVARALVLKGADDPRFVDRVRDADAVMHDDLDGAADALDRANQHALEAGYTDEQSASGLSMGLMIAAGFVLFGHLLGVQMFIRKRTRRQISPAVVVAGLIVIGWVMYAATACSAESHELKVVKQDAFDSISALSRARADAVDAQDRLYLALLDPASAKQAEIAFDRESNNLAGFSNGLTFAAVESAVDNNQLLPENFKGYIASELRNITFDGEQTAADEMLHDYARYDGIVAVVRQFEHQGDHTAAVRACLGDAPDEADGALKSFDAELGKTLEINQTEFDKAVVRGFTDVSGLELSTAVVLLAAAAIAQMGISQRLKEYRP